ncbi:3',5'-cyclic-nucleotide phosphodiesterase [Hymenobacter aerilatus]|uniref:3',5'-cyclic-nucleotide phosphodiesterase n=1 Tax=Hymenobacter aerilatus TaxID=2932251 RepID=A0A8T9SWQ7_9BACT|nr:3',5'-cyclic-nucleotide phosphodiesterase [Hymenobacter aerilatus]UOR06167.1 3',5'-cyclic-nucleotide phosphodiesterase [Hymenobacter aerilatus]
MSKLVVCLLLLLGHLATAQQPDFRVVPLGVRGGLDESNLSAYLVAPVGAISYACLDAGTIRAGVEKAVAQRALPGTPDQIIRRQIKAYLLSHAHLDHMAGLLLNAPDDTSKTLYGLPSCLAILQQHYFNWQSWPNFGTTGAAPTLGKYQYHPLLPGAPETAVAGTALLARAFPLSHGPGYESAAFLLRYGNNYLLYLGDTGPDAVEHSTRLAELWQAVAPLARAGTLRGIFMEVSYPNAQPDTQLFGHLTPHWLQQELLVLARLTGVGALRNLPIVVTHSKPTADNLIQIKQQLETNNTLRLRFIFPEQGQAFAL